MLEGRLCGAHSAIVIAGKRKRLRTRQHPAESDALPAAYAFACTTRNVRRGAQRPSATRTQPTIFIVLDPWRSSLGNGSGLHC